MRRFSLIALAGVLAFSVSGCGLLNRGGEEEVAEETIEPVPVAVDEDAAGEAEVAENFSEPLVAGTPQVSLPADLIKSTNPNERAIQVQKNRPDPFASLPIPAPKPASRSTSTTASSGSTINPRSTRTPTPQQSPVATRPVSSGGLPNLPGGTTNRGSSSSGTPSQGLGSGTPGQGLGNSIPALPALPQPDLAIAVEVTGVARVGSRVHAIVSAPNGPTSQYVRPGQRIANGQVLVKRIEVNRAEPVVILEQNGIEVAKIVGEGVSDTSTAAAVLPSQAIASNKT